MEVILVVLYIIIGYYLLIFLLGWLLPLHITTEKYLLYLLKKNVNRDFIIIAKPAIKEIAKHISLLSKNIAAANRGQKLQPYGYEMSDREYAVKFCVTASENIEKYLKQGVEIDNFVIKILKYHNLTKEKYDNIAIHIESENLLKLLYLNEENNLIANQIFTVLDQSIILPLHRTNFFNRQTKTLTIPNLFWTDPYVVGYTVSLCFSTLLFNFKGYHMTQGQRMAIISLTLYKICEDQWHIVLNKMLELQKTENAYSKNGINFRQAEKDALTFYKAVHQIIDKNEVNNNSILKEAIILSETLDDLPGFPNDPNIKLAVAILELTLTKHIRNTYTTTNNA